MIGLSSAAEWMPARVVWEPKAARPSFVSLERAEWDSAASPLMFPPKSFVLKPTMETNESAIPMLTDRVNRTLSLLMPLLDRAARRYGAQVRKVVISGFVDREDETSEIVVTQWVNLSAREAFEYWDLLGRMVFAWTQSLPKDLIPIAEERLSVQLEWNVNDATIQSA
jgi:hypothetical protein